LTEDLTNDDVNSLREHKHFLIRMRMEDWERLELVCATFGLSKAAAIRMSLVAMCRELGIS
jgi:hypothetical protein